jgi:hypothetical protein
MMMLLMSKTTIQVCGTVFATFTNTVMKVTMIFQIKSLCCNINIDNNLTASFWLFLLNKLIYGRAMGIFIRFAGLIRLPNPRKKEMMLNKRGDMRRRDKMVEMMEVKKRRKRR